ncbi:hypothetical protein ACLUXI_05475 [Bifidobacterium apri]|uniref:hypothetical protein n=1 Tax=Bifidobacterium apri TaxID=1769423 RepID=UPI003991C30D
MASITCLSSTREAVSDEVDSVGFALGDFDFFAGLFVLLLFELALGAEAPD